MKSNLTIFVQNMVMASITITERTLDKYFSFLRRLDIATRKKLIERLSDSINAEEEGTVDISALFGAWKDARSSDEIVREIQDARFRSRDIGPL